MSYTVITKNIPSTDGVHTLVGKAYIPESPKAIFHIVHGMCEHMDRYDRFMSLLAEAGYIACGYNHVGHKATSADSELGFFRDKGGNELLPDDVHAFGEAMRAEYTDLPYILMGHSMGSFVARLSASKYPDGIDGLIIMGTGGANPAAGAGIALTGMLIGLGMAKKVSGLIQNIAFGAYNDRTEKKTPNDWLTHDEEIIAKYSDDKYCTFKFTNSAMRDLIRMNRDSNTDACMAKYPADLPILIVSGDGDPVGDYGVAVEGVAKRLGELGKTNVKLILYPEMRHEILNEIGREKVDADILAWCEGVLSE